MQNVLDAMPVFERFVVLVYDQTSQYQRSMMPEKFYLHRRGEPLRTFPTADALLQHKERVACQAEHCWGQCLVSNPELPSPSLNGDGQNPGHMHGSLGGPPRHQKYARSL